MPTSPCSRLSSFGQACIPTGTKIMVHRHTHPCHLLRLMKFGCPASAAWSSAGRILHLGYEVLANPCQEWEIFLSYFLPLKLLSVFNKYLKECLKDIKGYYKLVFLLLPHRTNSITQLNAVCLQPRFWSQTFCLDELDTQSGAHGAGVEWASAGAAADGQLRGPELDLEFSSVCWWYDVRLPLTTDLCVSIKTCAWYLWAFQKCVDSSSEMLSTH